jgi:hypothetical protein
MMNSIFQSRLFGVSLDDHYPPFLQVKEHGAVKLDLSLAANVSMLTL